jgi:hypothetical protein
MACVTTATEVRRGRRIGANRLGDDGNSGDAEIRALFGDDFAIRGGRPPKTPIALMHRVHQQLSHFELLSKSLYNGAAGITYRDGQGGTRTFDCFTNELGLWRAAVDSGVKGGAVVGVGGSVLDLAAATRAEVVICVDANPAIADWMYFITAVFALVDERAKKGRWDDAAAAREVERLLDPPSHEADAVAKELERALAKRLPEDVRGRLPELIRAVHHRATESLSPGLPTPMHWFQQPDAPAAVAHLRKLAREGKMYCITSTLDAPGLNEGIARLCAWHRAEVKSVNLSNAYEYMQTSRPVFEKLGALPLADDAKLFLVSGHIKAALDRGELVGAADTALARSLGNALEGAAVSARKWLGPNGRGQEVDDLIWRTPSCLQMIAWNAVGPKIEAVGMEWLNAAGIGLPTSPAELERLEKLLDAELARR